MILGPFCRACRFLQPHMHLNNVKISRLINSKSICTEGETTAYQELTHTPVMQDEVVEIFQPKSNQVFLDMTYGGGGHSRALLELESNLHIFALDRDPDSYNRAQINAGLTKCITPLLGRFSEVHLLLDNHGIGPNSVDGVIFDVGASSFQFDIPERGFSLSKDGPLDMRMDKDRFPDQPTAADVVNYLDESGLYKLLKKYGEETKAKHIARSIVESRHAFGYIKTTHQLASVVESAFVGPHKQDKLMRHSHVATKTFQALRTFVNNELNEFYTGLEIVYQLLKPGGICVAIAFHSLEDRIAKRLFHGINMEDKLNKTLLDHRRDAHQHPIIYSEIDMKKILYKKWEPLLKKPVLPSEEEVTRNPRARSAKLRAARKRIESDDKTSKLKYRGSRFK